MPPPTQQRQNSWLSRFTNLILTSSVVRYGTLIFLVALISVLYFATTHQVMKTQGLNANVFGDLITIIPDAKNPQNLFNIPNNNSISSGGTMTQIGTYKGNNTVKGLLYDRGNGCVDIISPVIPQGYSNLSVGLVSINDASCQIDTIISNSINYGDIGLIILRDPQSIQYDNNTNMPIFIVGDPSFLIVQLTYVTNNYNKTKNEKQVLRVTFTTAQAAPVNSWLFAMFAVGGILVTSFFISILIHMRLYRLRRNHQEEIRRQRIADEITGMRKWTLDQDDIDSLPVFTYSKKTATSNKSTEVSTSEEVDEKDNPTATNKTNEDNENSGDKSNGDVETKESSTVPQSLSHKSSVRSTKSTRSTISNRSTKSARSQKAISNAVSLYTSTDSTQNHLSSDDDYDMLLEETCAICLEDFDDGDKIRELPCRHCYHVECIDPWLTTKSSSCPLCKKDCKPSIGGGNNENTSISVNIENETHQSQANQNSMNASHPNVVLRMGRLLRGYFSSQNRGSNNTRNLTTNPSENENGMELESVRSTN
ncbi:20640_t:CDS:1 [Cetraspora pellucida]|uniref:20640_t:CDS:1 n=1 Tax=Cetraspora pellucida TaxID=1433469 RepID=A0A9N9CNM8_9GLOM|nr:20640_t:CDS:1 [Cetraspora pellucida]